VNPTVRVNATMDAELVRRIDAYAEGRLEDRSTALRQLADFALREMALRDALAAYRDGRVSLREFARTLGVDLWHAHDLLRAQGVAVAQGSRDESGTGLADVLADLDTDGARSHS
jgi:predicted HTH domain antitoxin